MASQALTIKANGKLNRIITDVSVCEAFDTTAPPNPIPTLAPAKGLWDTGATRSVISQDLAATLGLRPSGTAQVLHGGGSSTSPTYLVNFLLPHGVGIVGVQVTEFPAKDPAFNVILGMDVICIGDFAVTNVSGQTWMSFRTPSSEAIDYVVQVNRSKYGGARPNDPCPCGSGKKYKKCHRP
jgi:hypothetical protein